VNFHSINLPPPLSLIPIISQIPIAFCHKNSHSKFTPSPCSAPNPPSLYLKPCSAFLHHEICHKHKSCRTFLYGLHHISFSSLHFLIETYNFLWTVSIQVQGKTNSYLCRNFALINPFLPMKVFLVFPFFVFCLALFGFCFLSFICTYKVHKLEVAARKSPIF
jgi:hypothetical protein